MFNIEISSDNNVRKPRTGNNPKSSEPTADSDQPDIVSAIYKEMGWNSGDQPELDANVSKLLNRLTQEIKKFQILASNSEKQKKEVIDELQNILKEKTGDEKDDLIKSLESKLNKQREITIAMSALRKIWLHYPERRAKLIKYMKNRKLKEEKISLEEKLNTQKTIHLKSSSSFNEQINLLNEQLQAKQAELDSIKEKGVAEVPKEQSLDMDNLKKENDELKDKIQSNEALIGKKNEELEAMKTELVKNKEEYSKKMEEFNAQIEAFSKQKDDTAADAKHEIEEATKALSSKEEVIQELSSKITGKNEEINVLNSKIMLKENEITELKSTIDENSQRISNMEQELENKKNDVATLSADLNAKNEQILKLKEENIKIGEFQAFNEDMRNQVTELEKRNQGLNGKLDAKNEQINNLNSEIQNLKQSLEMSKSMVEESKDLLSTAESLKKEISQLKNNIADKDKNLTQVREDLLKANADNKDLSFQIENLNKEITEHKADIEAKKESIEDLVEDNERYKAEFNELRESLSNIEGKGQQVIKDLNEKITANEIIIKDLKAENTAIKEK